MRQIQIKDKTLSGRKNKTNEVIADDIATIVVIRIR